METEKIVIDRSEVKNLIINKIDLEYILQNTIVNIGSEQLSLDNILCSDEIQELREALDHQIDLALNLNLDEEWDAICDRVRTNFLNILTCVFIPQYIFKKKEHH